MAAHESTMTTGAGSSSNSSEQDVRAHAQVNVSETERWLSAIGGGALALYGLTRGTFGGVALALVGGGLLYRGASGHCTMYQALGRNTSEPTNPNVSVRGGSGIKVEQSLVINKTPAELFRFWRNFENLPRFMQHVEAVRVSDPTHSHWTVSGPAGTSVEWDAEVYNEEENRLIAWRSLPGADVDNAGSVHFEPAAGGRGTIVRVVLKYDPPAGIVGATVAKLFGEEPAQQIAADLRRFKQLLETGEVATITGQASGRA